MALSDGINLFGFQIKKANQKENWSVVPPVSDDGSTIGNSSNSYYGMALDLEGSIKNDNDLIRRYREISNYADCNSAIEEIINEAIVAESNKVSISVQIDELQAPDKIKALISQEFDQVLKLFDFEERGHDIFRQWYVDGRLFYNVIMSPNIQNGIAELRFIDPRKIRKIKNIKKERDPKTGVDIITNIEEYYLFNDKGISEQTTAGVKMSLDSVVYGTSGLLDYNTGFVLSYLHDAIKPCNQLKVMEDALVIYRITRSPERRVFYIDVGNLPKLKAEQHIQEQMNLYRNKIVYDSSTGEIKDGRAHLSMTEDFWLGRRGDGKSTEITTLPGGANLSSVEDIAYFQTKLYQALKVPISRLQPQQGFSLGRSNEITRDEIKFNKFIERLRRKFASIFRDTLRIQLISKGIIRPDEWDEIASFIRFDFQKDNNFAEFKTSEILQQRMALLNQIQPFVGVYYSMKWVMENVLMLTEQDREIMAGEIQQEIKLMPQPQPQQGDSSQ